MVYAKGRQIVVCFRDYVKVAILGHSGMGSICFWQGCYLRVEIYSVFYTCVMAYN